MSGTRCKNRMQSEASTNVRGPGCCSFMGGYLPALDLNVGFLQSIPGAFKIAQTVLGAICLIIIAYISQLYHPLNGLSLGLLCSKSSAFFLLVSYSCFSISFLQLVCSAVSYFTASFLPKTLFEFVYHLFSCLMYLSSSFTLLFVTIVDSTESGGYNEPYFAAKISAAVLGILNGILYGVSTYFSYQSQKQMG